ncbi:uncharacterized protein ACLA_054170 [Aspergillus clavatus NRRL 1]|uniref:Uncharacterized protein n=1 Tax=Aspergillus clavatus (strain ATCC 1007 / CBS 513.65 / DSM 816 / NCTC 3887 / NRRL 1 / QM 1276 / 107) TaxID=344612 RepID=A1C946_ASPCL|nr:uncharacterized protein ACLA_054170 [Aspergillus clavatus NRRL 1]EAW13370.1 conserved hypothetical protein [Aspergillus clavatus NRRL 1]
MGSYSGSRCPGRCAPTGGSYSSTNSDASDRSKSTAPTIYSDRPTSKRYAEADRFAEDQDPKDSVSTYASTIPSVDDDDVPEEPQYEVVDRRPEIYATDAIPSHPSTFADLFPSSRRLLIRHDDATLDGNMNLRVDTLVPRRGGYQQDVILFHLRMYDLFSRKFSLRRYCRDSGREVCHSERRPRSSSIDKRPILQRSWSSVLAGLRPGSSGNGSITSAEHKRHDSGYNSIRDGEGTLDDATPDAKDGPSRPVALGDTTLLEFSNYAHVEVRRRGAGLPKRYDFEYWSTKYQWKKECRKEGDLREVSYHLINTKTSKVIAHIVPEILTPMEAVEEESKGGWVPPSSMWISDSSVYETMHDVADVIIATGLIVLVDDCIRRRWHSKRHAQSNTHTRKHSFTKSIEFMAPMRLIDEVFHRRGSA